MASELKQRVPVVVHGASGRMGQALLGLLAGDPVLELAAALVSADSAMIGERVWPMQPEGPRYAATLVRPVPGGVLVDFSTVEGFGRALDLAHERGLAFVSGTTGLGEAQWSALAAAARDIPVLWAANFSLGIAMLTRLVELAARALPDWDCEIVEAHHARKLDAPSGTALALGRAVAAARGQDFDAVAVPARAGRGTSRQLGEIGFAAIRAGDIVGEHSVFLGATGERLELAHRASDRTIFARGALTVARWIAGRPPGRCLIEQVLFGQ